MGLPPIRSDCTSAAPGPDLRNFLGFFRRSSGHHALRVPGARPLRQPPIGFAHRGARSMAPENTLEAFRLARALGAGGLESDVWITRDGEAVLDHDGVVGGTLRRRPIADVDRAALPSHIPALAELYEDCGTDFELSLDVKDPAAFDRVLAVADAAGATRRLWLCHPDWQVVAGWRERSSAVRLVDSTRLAKIKEGPERRAASLSQAGIDAINMHHADWTTGLITLFHRFERYCFGWDAQRERHIAELLQHGADAVYSDHVDRLVAALPA
jgi:glycerophosphoryl diester phosphodiesterase